MNVSDTSARQSASPSNRRGGRRSLDHYVILVQDLERAGSTYERLGFRVLPRMQHIEIGSVNRVVQFQRTYLELIGEIENAGPLVRNNLEPRLACGEGLCMVSLDSNDLERDRKKVDALGLDPAPIISARRKIKMPDGSLDETDSRCFYIWRPQRRYMSLFLSDHRKPETIWVTEYQQHPNTAVETTGIVYVSDEPARDRDYFGSVYGCRPEYEDSGLIRFRGARDDVVEIYDRNRLAERFPASPPEVCEKLPGYPVAIQVSVRDPEALLSILQRNGISYHPNGDTVLVDPRDAHGVLIEFVAVSN